MGARLIWNLIVARCASQFDPLRDVALGPWCFVGCEELYPEWETLPFVRPFESRDVRRANYFECIRLCRRRIYDLVPLLNARHGVNYSLAYWYYIAGPWLLHLVNISWSRFVHLEKFIETSNTKEFDASVLSGGGEWKIRDALDLHDRLQRDHVFHFWLLSMILRKLAVPNIRLIDVPFPPGYRERMSEQHELSEPATTTSSGRFSDILRLPTFDRFGTVYGFSPRREAKLLSVILAVRPPARPRARNDGEWAFYKPEKHFPVAYLDLLDDLIKATMPETLKQRYKLFHDKALKRHYRPGRICIDNANYWREKERFLTAQAIEGGEVIVRAQHGGNSGTNEFHAMNAEFEMNHDAFLTWGWDGCDNHQGQFVPLPSPLLSRKSDAHRQEESTLILVGNQLDVCRDGMTGPAGAEVVRYRREKMAFLKGLAPHVLASVIYRPFHKEQNTLEDEEYIKRVFKDIPIMLSSKAFRRRMLRCRLLVLDHCGTTLPIAMAANVPLVSFWPYGMPFLTRQAEPIYERLEKCGLLFHSACEAAEKVNEVWDNVQRWWLDADIQDARRNWCDRYARANSGHLGNGWLPRHWLTRRLLWEWCKTLWHL